jgi:hypothetical protein
MMSLKFRQPTFSDLRAQLQKATGVPISLDPRLENQSAGFALVAHNPPVWVVMEHAAKHMVLEGRWERVGDGYRLMGAPKNPSPTPPPSASASTILVAVNVCAVGLLVVLLVSRRFLSRWVASRRSNPSLPRE